MLQQGSPEVGEGTKVADIAVMLQSSAGEYADAE